MNTTHTHPLDEALALVASAPGVYQGRTTAAYWNMVGPYGGLTAAVLLNAVLQHPALLGEPVSLTVNFAAAVTEGAFSVQATPVRTNRSTQHWTVTATQLDADGQPQVTTTATVVTAVRRETWSAADSPMPAVASPAHFEAAAKAFPVQWLKRYEMRPIAGNLPAEWDGREAASLSQLWVRDAPARSLDFCALAALADVFFPRVWLRRARHVPAGTVSITVYFYASGAELAQAGSGYLLGQASTQEFRNGFFDQGAQLWSEAGRLLATSQQIVYYKE